uniref:Potassium/proton antiporter CemA n=1 Tax=Edaphochlorella mirabilis TaxID=3083 RepID=A0A097KKL3_9CHLO|nr:chloroplast enveloppe membrane protein [Edaphochlorella mirabilis]AIT93726.1 chloroplast enveloppe membrane protein [Edaphochlorella mirabilis]
MTKQAIEQTGLIPRSIIRTFDRFRIQLLSGTEKLVIQEFRISRYQVLVSVKCLLSLIILPILINCLLKNFLVLPLTTNFWNTHQQQIFLNSDQQNRAFIELSQFEEKIYFEFLLDSFNKNPAFNNSLSSSNEASISNQAKNKSPLKTLYSDKYALNKLIREDIQRKTSELAVFYNQESIIALTNLFGDVITFIIIGFLIIWMKPQIIILQSFLTESIYSLSDTTKSFLLILGTDLLVGFHSPRGWEIFLELILQHFGFPENEDFIFLFVATFPVLLDTVFKYWIFRYLNQISPSTVATYHSMIE